MNTKMTIDMQCKQAWVCVIYIYINNQQDVEKYCSLKMYFLLFNLVYLLP